MILASGASTNANNLRERSFDDNVRDSDVIVIGRAISAPHSLVGAQAGDRYVTFEIIRRLKGDVSKTIEVQVVSLWREADPNCCNVSQRYLLLLKHLAPAQYKSTNGRFTVLGIE
jgi:hypothetical protein